MAGVPSALWRAEFRGTERYELRALLGVGAMGVVYEAFDRELGVVVALKCLPSTSPQAALRFKREFRSLRDLHHENLVKLGELVSVDDQLFFTMELIDGTDIVSYCRHLEVEGPRRAWEQAAAGDATIDAEPGAVELPSVSLPRVHGRTADEERVRLAFAALTRGLMALHAASKVHRDVKPSNVLVTREGRVALLDFGVVLDSAPEAFPSDGRLVGTVNYMSPEQAARGRIAFESDWYSVGVMLFEVLTQRLPFEGPSGDVLQRKQTETPPRAREFTPTLARELDELCSRLLDPRRERRPNPQDILRILEGSASLCARGLPASTAGFVGREEELARLNQALARAHADRASMVHIEGQSGTGKTALLRDFVARLASQRNLLVLQACCSEREYVPYRAVDGAIDALAEFVTRSGSAPVRATLDAHLPHLVRAFPLFGRTASSPPAAAEVVETAETADPYVARLSLFRALRALLTAVRKESMVVLVLDDMQWADADSLALLSAVIRPPLAPAILIVVASRLHWAERSLLRAWGAENIALGNLPVDDAVQLARRLLSQAQPEVREAEQIAQRVAAEAAGHPLFIDELVRQNVLSSGPFAGQVTLDSALSARVERLPPRSRMLVQLVAIARSSLAVRVLTRAAGSATDDATALSDLVQLRNEHLLDLDGTGAASGVRTYHDRVGAAVLARMADETQCELHGALARALEAEPDRDPEQLAVHWERAGALQAAARYAVTAAVRAGEALAFEQAAHFYQMALNCWPEQPNAARIREALGDELANAGLGPAAARAYLDASASVDEAARLDLERRAADQLFRAGHIDEAEPLIRRVLRHMGMSIPDSLLWILLALLISRLRLAFTRADAVEPSLHPVSARALAELNACWSVAVGLSMVSNLRGACLQNRHLLLAAKLRQRLPLVRALATEASYVAVRGQGARLRAERLLSRAEQLARDIKQPYARGFTTLSRAICAFLMGDWSQARSLARVAERVFETRPAGAMWELASARTFGLWAHYYLGDLTGLGGRVSEFIHEAETRGDRYAATLHRTGVVTMVWLATDEPELARQHVREAEIGWSRETFDFQRYLITVGHCLIDLYEDAPVLAHRRICEMWPPFRRSQYLRIQCMRFEALYLRGAAAIGSAASGNAAALLREAEHCARRIARERVTWSTAMSLLLLAGVADARGQVELARKHWRGAQRAAAAHEMALFAAAAEYRLALSAGAAAAAGEPPAAHWAPALHTVREPERLCRVLAPIVRQPGYDNYGGLLAFRGRGMS